MDSKALFAERMELFDKVMGFERPKRVPTYGNVYAWKAIDSDLNVTIEEAGASVELAEKVMREFQERYRFDLYQNPGNRFSSLKQKILGEARVHSVVNGNEVVTFDRSPMRNDDDEIREYFQNPVKFLWTKTAPRLYHEGEGLTLGGAKELIADDLAFKEFNIRINKILFEEYGVPYLQGQPSMMATFLHPLENYGMTRGLKDFGLDLRRRKNLVKEIIAPMEEAAFENLKHILNDMDSTNWVFDVFTCVMMNTIMSVKQFEELYWPLMKKQFDYIQEQGKRVFFLCEADYIRFAEFFNDYPKGTICLLPEMEDVRDVRKASPHCAICGGMPVDLLGKATVTRCLDFAKQLIDDMGYGFILGQNKFLSYEYDAKRENLLAVQDYALNYRY